MLPDLIWSILPDADAGFGIEMVQALDAAHAQDIAKAQHPSGRLSAVPAELSVPLGAGEMTDA